MELKSAEEKEQMANVPYMEAIGSILYVSQVSRPDISYAVNISSTSSETLKSLVTPTPLQKDFSSENILPYANYSYFQIYLYFIYYAIYRSLFEQRSYQTEKKGKILNFEIRAYKSIRSM